MVQIILSLVYLILSAGFAFAADIHISDSDGLTRSTKELRGESGAVTVSISAPAEGTRVTLANTDGVATDRQCEQISPTQFRARGVPAGNWRIVVDPPRSVLEVRVE